MLSLIVLAALFTAAPPKITLYTLHYHAGGVTLEPIEIERGAPARTFECSERTGILDLILPPAFGSSAGLARFSDGKTIEVEWTDAGLSVRDSLAAGASYSRPVRDPTTLADEVVRVSVLPWQGEPRSFRIEGHAQAEPDDGPPLDLFQGKIPLGSGDFVISTETTKRPTPRRGGGKATLGKAVSPSSWPLLEVTRADGKTGTFVVDVGAVSTIVARSFVPDGVAIDELSMTQFRGGNAEVLPFSPQGATGKVSVLGEAPFDLLRAGTIEWREAKLLVVEELPRGASGPIDGILGLDLLSQFGTLRFDWKSGELALGEKGSAEQDRVPFALVGGAVIVRGRLGMNEMYFLVDSGAPDTFVENASAERFGLPVANVSRPASGLDGGEVEVATCGNQSLSIGDGAAFPTPILVADFPVLATRRSGKYPLGILGMTALRHFESVRFDFVQRRIRFED